MQGSKTWAEVLCEIGALKAECELLIRMVEAIEDDGGGGHAADTIAPGPAIGAIKESERQFAYLG